MPITISTINLCLGLKNKKLLVKRLLEENKIDVLCMQETEIGNDLNTDQLMMAGYSFELEKNTSKLKFKFNQKKNLTTICHFLCRSSVLQYTQSRIHRPKIRNQVFIYLLFPFFATSGSGTISPDLFLGKSSGSTTLD